MPYGHGATNQEDYYSDPRCPSMEPCLTGMVQLGLISYPELRGNPSMEPCLTGMVQPLSIRDSLRTPYLQWSHASRAWCNWDDSPSSGADRPSMEPCLKGMVQLDKLAKIFKVISLQWSHASRAWCNYVIEVRFNLHIPPSMEPCLKGMVQRPLV